MPPATLSTLVPNVTDEPVPATPLVPADPTDTVTASPGVGFNCAAATWPAPPPPPPPPREPLAPPPPPPTTRTWMLDAAAGMLHVHADISVNV
ncbi:MAG: hypothetical protein DWI55_05340 [Chloroflexi bacterium]|nr:MAG: hypothetical protein DWI55_05340 [Chloroflexota bacterium]